jgi:predicted Zn-dependent protease
MAGLADTLKSQGDIDGAIKVWEQLDAKIPGAPEVTLGLADAYLAKKKYEKAIPLLESLEKAIPDDKDIRKKLAKARSADGK